MDEPRYFDRELSWLEFNQRVLCEALDESLPLLERLKFLAITASNLDEFFRVRVGAMKLVLERSEGAANNAGLTPAEQLRAVHERIRKMVADQYRCLHESQAPALAQQKIRRLQMAGLNAGQQRFVRQLLDREVLSILTPIPVATQTPFPLLGPGVNVFARVRTPLTAREGSTATAVDWTAVIPLGKVVSRFLTLPSEAGLTYLLMEEVICHYVQQFFPEDVVLEAVPFRITRSAEVELQEFSPMGLAGEMEEVLVERVEADCIRLEISSSASQEAVDFLKNVLGLDDQDVFRLDGPLDLGSLMDLAQQPGFEKLRYEPWPAINSPDVPSEELIFDILSERDVLLYHPYESFEPVIRLVEEAAEDPDVLAIKQTLYRVSRDSRIIQALLRAVDNGKHVTVLVELKARFDEARNLKQARELERKGAQVIWGVKGLKTHAKLCIVVRREPQGIQRYVHFGTGNYNESTAKLYSDASLLTCADDLGADAVAFFNAIAAYSQPRKYRKIEAAPLRLRDALIEMIHGEAKRSTAKRPGRIVAKLNALVDPELIDALYEASQAGVEIKLNVRGICCLRPGVPGLSETIQVVSIVDRFLEHARILSFDHGGQQRVFISSADWMQRNLDHRKELLVPVDDSACRERLQGILESYFQDNVKAWVLGPDGTYERRVPQTDEPQYRVQEELYRLARRTVKTRQKRRRTVFEPHRPD